MSGYNVHTRKLKEQPCDACREAMRAHWKQQRVNRNESINTLRRAWRQRTPGGNRRGRRYKGEVGLYSDIQVVEMYGARCHICNGPIDLDAPRQCGKSGWEKSLHIDHVFPLSKGGLDTIENVRPSHGQCNIIKWATVS
jgi:5-methylcytosine-specific restriction endonuclease McrA